MLLISPEVTATLIEPFSFYLIEKKSLSTVSRNVNPRTEKLLGRSKRRYGNIFHLAD
jgi:hypothetical protein